MLGFKNVSKIPIISGPFSSANAIPSLSIWGNKCLIFKFAIYSPLDLKMNSEVRPHLLSFDSMGVATSLREHILSS